MNTRLKAGLIFFSVFFVVTFLINEFILNVDAGVRYNLMITLIGGAVATTIFMILPKTKKTNGEKK